MKKFSWAFVIFIVGLLFGSSKCQAQAQCPWLNAATAGGMLGGDVVTKISGVTPLGDATCDFMLTRSTMVLTLNIAVHTMADPAKEFAKYLSLCDGTKTPLHAIGNEAVQCVANGGSKSGEEQIIGRVRERAFVITIHGGTVKPGAMALSEEAENLAQQVAGAMF